MEMTPEVYKIWNKIHDVSISNDATWSMYTLQPEEGDKTLFIYNNESDQSRIFTNVQNPSFSNNNRLAIFQITLSVEKRKELKRAKVKKDDFPKDSLVLFDLSTQEVEYISSVKSYSIPDDPSDYVAYHLYPDNETPDSLLYMPRESTMDGERNSSY